MKKIKEGLINEEIVRRYPGFDNREIILKIKEKEVGQEVMIMRKLLLKSWGTWMQKCLEGRMLGVSSQVL